MLTASVWSMGRVSIGQEEEKKKHTFLTTHGKAELWRAAHTCCSEGACFTYGPNGQHAAGLVLAYYIRGGLVEIIGRRPRG